MAKRLTALFLALVMALGLSAPVMGESAPPPPGHIIINQVYGPGSNTDGAVSHGFVELYNPTGSDVDISGWSLQYASSGASWSKLDLSGVIPARHSYLIVFTRDVSPAARYKIPAYDAAWNLRIDNKSVKVALVSNNALISVYNPTENIVDLVGIGSDWAEGAMFDGISKQKAARRIAFADTDNNSADFELYDYRLPTSGVTDEKLAEIRPRCLVDGAWGGEIVPPDKRLEFSVPGGLYTASFQLELTTGYSGASIYYTTDGSDPGPGKRLYSAPIAIADRTNDANWLSAITAVGGKQVGVGYRAPTVRVFKGTVVKAQVFSSDGKALSDVVTRSYFVNPNIMTKYNLPIVSLSTDYANFFDAATGIYVNYDESGADWERPVYAEYYDENGQLRFSMNMGVRTHGGYTRQFGQKSLRLYAKSGYDPQNPSIKCDLFDGTSLDINGEPIVEFQRIILRNSGNDNGTTMFRDAMMQCALSGLNVDTQASRPCVVFLDGEFWGIYNIRERIDRKYIASKYLLNEDNVAMLTFGGSSVPEIDEGDENDVAYYNEMYDFFNSTASFSGAEAYAKAQTYIDVDNFIDYYVAQIFIDNTDWPANNNVIWRYRAKGGYAPNAPAGQDGRWRWVFKDLDFGLGLYGHAVSENLLAMLLNTTNPAAGQATWSTLFFRRLLTNAEFKEKFINRFSGLMSTDLLSSVLVSDINTHKAHYTTAMGEHISRFQAIANTTTWNNNVNTMITYANGRASYVAGHLRTAFSLGATSAVTLKTDSAKGFMSINGIDIKTTTKGVLNPDNWSGAYYFAGMTQTVEAKPLEGWAFSHFSVTAGTQTSAVTDNPAKVTVASGGVTVEAVYVPAVVPAVAAPQADPPSGTSFYGSLSVTLTCETPGAAIYYTTDGSEPTADSAAYSAPIVLAETATVKAVAIKSGMADSEVAAFVYTRLPTPASASLASSISTIVEGCAANIPVTAEVSNPDGESLTLALVAPGGAVIRSMALSSGGKYVFSIAADEAAEGAYIIRALSGEKVLAEISVECVAKPASLWTPAVSCGGDGEIKVTFPADISFSALSKSVKIGSQTVDPSLVSIDGRVVTIRGDAKKGDKIVIAGLKYYILFPSYAFTFTLTAP